MSAGEAYVMPAYVKLLVADAARARRFYEALGFTCVQADELFTHLRWARHADVFLVAAPAGMTLPTGRGVGVIVCFSAGASAGDGDASLPSLELLVERVRGAGGASAGPATQPWHTRELVVTDPDGYRLAFVEPA